MKSAVIVIGFWVAPQLFSGYAPIIEHTAQQQGGSVAYLAHVGGCTAGLILSFFFRRPLKAKRDAPPLGNPLSIENQSRPPESSHRCDNQ